MPSNQNSDLPTAEQWSSVKQIAHKFDVTERTVRRWIDEGRLRTHRFGGAVRVSAEDLRDFIESSRR